MRLIQLLTLTVLFTAQLAWADGIPDYSYFYPCSSGLVDCSGFPIHHGGTSFGWMLPDVGIEFGPATDFSVIASNNQNEFSGTIGTTRPLEGMPGYGAAGQVYCIFGGCGEHYIPVDINNNGVYLFNFNGASAVHIGFGAFGENIESIIDGVTGVYNVRWTFGINDSDQILARVDTQTAGDVLGVLSPFAVPVTVPEASSLLLLATVAGITLLVDKLRRTAGLVLACRAGSKFTAASHESAGRVCRHTQYMTGWVSGTGCNKPGCLPGDSLPRTLQAKLPVSKGAET